MIVVISDLHMSSGKHDDFEFDKHLVEFLKSAGKVFGRKVKKKDDQNVLVLNGDIFDILEAPGKTFKEKKRGIEKKHRKSLKAINDLAGAFQVVYLRGNHDWDAFRPANVKQTQSMFPKVVVAGNPDSPPCLIGKCRGGTFKMKFKSAFDGKVTVHVEHGNQHEPFNNFFHNDPQNPQTSLGSLIVTELIDMLETVFPNIDNLRLGDFAVEIRKRLKTITDKYELDGTAPNTNQPGFFGRLNRAVRRLGDGIRAEAAEQRREALVRLARVLLGVIIGRKDSITEAAWKIASGPKKRIVVFGHTHAEEALRRDKGAFYLNSGTWTRMYGISPDGEAVERKPRSYVTISFNRPLSQIATIGEGVCYYKGPI